MKFKRSFFHYLIPPTIVTAFLCVVFFIKGVFPFGDVTIANAHASSDLAQLFVPMYTHVWDFLHGDTSLFFTFLSGAGINMAGSISFSGLLSPLNLFFYLIPRAQIMEYMSVFLIIKTALMSVAAFWYFRKRFDCPLFYSILFSVAYALSGYVMMYYVHNMWLDCAILLPFLLYSAENVLRGKKVYPFIICFTLMLILSIYIAFMISLFLLIVGGVYLFLAVNKKDRGHNACRFILGALSSLMISTPITLPATLQLFSSKRATLNAGIDGILFNTDFSSFTHKLTVFLGMGIALVLLLVFFFKHEKNSKIKWLCALAILVPLLPVIFENINLIWHLGGYFGPANRMGFITVFVMLAVCAYSLSKYGDTFIAPAKSTLLNLFILGCCGVAAFSTVAIFSRLDGNINLIINMPQKLFFILGISAISFILAMMLKWKKLRYTCIAIMYSVLTLCMCIGFIAIYPKYIQSEQTDAYISETVKLKEQLEINSASYSENALNRIKDTDSLLTSNYSYILSKAALSGWSHSLALEIQPIMRSLGYTRWEMRLSDSGGTVFSDAVLGYTQAISKTKLSDRLYTLESSQNGMNVYNNNFILPFSILADSSITDLDANYRSDAFAFSNELYSSLVNDKEPLFKTINTSGLLQENGNIHTYEIHISGEQVLYYFNNDRLEDNACKIKVNGKLLTNPYFGNENNALYPVTYNNGIITLGTFADELVTVELEFSSAEAIPSNDVASFALMSIEKMHALCDVQNTYSTTANAKFNSISISKTVTDADLNMLLIPMYHDSGWSCTVNSKPVSIQTVLGGFMCIELSEGENQIELAFSPTGLNLGLLLALLALIITLVAIITFRFKPFTIPAFIGNIFTAVFYTATALVLLAVYILPILITLIFV
ncbi:MAG: YfhO family protein [Clostridia bacterium]|nr:YfhO family protein [Clostridia bacterium]